MRTGGSDKHVPREARATPRFSRTRQLPGTMAAAMFRWFNAGPNLRCMTKWQGGCIQHGIRYSEHHDRPSSSSSYAPLTHPSGARTDDGG
jgi:hypothetical protein